MLPGEEYAVERWYRAAREVVSRNAPPHGDGSVWWFNPQAVSGVLLGAIAVLLLVRFGGDAKTLSLQDSKLTTITVLISNPGADKIITGT